jgi:hypothetical protein
LLDNIFQQLAPPAAARETAPRGPEDPLALARDYVSKGLMDLAASEAARAVQRGADRGDAAVLLGDIFARRGLHGEALERYREARALDEARPDALLGEVRALMAHPSTRQPPRSTARTDTGRSRPPRGREVPAAAATPRARSLRR